MITQQLSSTAIAGALGYTPASLGANSFTGDQTITSTDAGAAVGPLLDLFRDSASPAANDVIGGVGFTGKSSTGVTRTYAAIRGETTVVTDGAEYGGLGIHMLVNGTLSRQVFIDQFNAKITLGSSLNTIQSSGSNFLHLGGVAANQLSLHTNRASVASAVVLGWTDGASSATVDTSMAREAAAIIGTPGSFRVMNALAIPAGGTAGAGYKFSSTANFGLFFGSGAPTLSVAKGSLYLRSDGSGVGDRLYVNTDGGTTWTAVTTAA